MLSLKSRHGLFVFLGIAIAAVALLLLVPRASADPEPPVALADQPAYGISADQNAVHTSTGTVSEVFTVTPTPIVLSAGGSPQPNDAPFSTNVNLTTNTNEQTNPTVAVDTTGRLYVAFQNFTGASWDIYVKYSDDGGQTWTQVAVATQAYNEINPSIHTHFQSGGTHINVFYSQNNVAANMCWYHSDNAISWTNQCLAPSFGGGFTPRNYGFASQASFGLVSYVAWDVQDAANGNTRTLVWFYSVDAFHTTAPANWAGTGFSAAFHPGDQWTKPQVFINESIYTFDLSDSGLDGCVLFSMLLSNPGPTFGFAGDGTADIALVNPLPDNDPSCGNWYFYISENLFGGALTGVEDSDPEIVDLGAAFGYGWTWTFNDTDSIVMMIRDPGDGFLYLETPGIETGADFRYPQAFSANGLILLSFIQDDTIATWTWSGDGGVTWDTEYKVSDNAGTAVRGFHSIAVAYSQGVQIVWQDDRSGDTEIFWSNITGWHFYFVTRDPLLGDVTVNGAATPAPSAFFWQEGTLQNVSVPSLETDPVDPNIRYSFDRWSDLGPIAHDVTVGTMDLTLTAFYNTEYYISISAPYGSTTPPSGWYLNGTVLTLQVFLPANTADTRYVWAGWISSGCPGSYDGLNNPASITVNCPIVELGQVTREFLVTVTSPYGVPTGGGWYTETSTVSVSVNTPVAGPPGSRFAFDIWSGSGPGAYDGSQNPVSFLLLGPVTENARWFTEFNLTMTTGAGTVLPGSSWQRQGSVVSLLALSPAVGIGERYVFDRWTGSSTLLVNPATITMDSAKTYNAAWFHQWYLAVTANFGILSCAPSPCGWYNQGTSVSAQAIPPAAGIGERYTVVGWTGSGTGSYSGTNNPITVTVSAYITEAMRFRHEFQVTLSANFGTVSPGSGWYEDGMTVQTSAVAPQSTATERYAGLTWTGTGAGSYTGVGNPATFTVTGAPLTEVATWEHQFLLDVRTDFGGVTCLPVGSPGPCGWYAVGTAVQISATPPGAGAGEQYVWIGWTGTGASGYSGAATSPTITLNDAVVQMVDFRHEFQVTLTTNQPGVTVSPPSGWYEAGTTLTFSSTPTITASGERFTFTAWSGAPALTGNPVSVLLDARKTYEAQWTHEYFLDITANAGASVGCNPTPCGWYASGTSVTISATAPGAGANERFFWGGWTGSGSGSYSGTITTPSIVMNAPIAEAGGFTHEFELRVTSIYGSAQGAGWYADGETAVVTVTSPDLVSAGTRYVLTAWAGDATGSSDVLTFTMDAAKSVTATWSTEYLLTVNSAYGNPTGAGWYPAGTNAAFEVLAFEYTTDTDRWSFTAWTGDSTATTAGASVAMSAPKTVDATWSRQYWLDVTSGYGTLNGAGWYASGTLATFGVSASEFTLAPGSRVSFLAWSGASSATTISASVVMDSAKAVSATWGLQYYLDWTNPRTSITVTPARGWFDAGSAVTLAVQQTSESITTGEQYLFTGWTGTASSGAASLSLTMDRAHTLIATWEHQFQYTIQVTPTLSPSISIQVDGTTLTVPGFVWLTEGTAHTLLANLRVLSRDYNFVAWRDGTLTLTSAAPEATISVTPTSAKTLTLEYVKSTDTDGDGLPDAWEKQYWAVLTDQNASGDPDGDGLTNLQEFSSHPQTNPIVKEEQSFFGPLVNNPIWLVLFIILIAVVVVLAILVARKKKPVQVIEESMGPAPPVQESSPPGPANAPPPPPSAAPPPAEEPAVEMVEGPAGQTVECTNCGILNDAGQANCAVCGTALPGTSGGPDKAERIRKLQGAYKAGRISKEQYEENMRKLSRS